MNGDADKDSAHFESDAPDAEAAARKSGKELGRAWAEEQQGYDKRWLDPDSEYVEVSLYDLTFALRDRAYDHAYMDERMEAFIEGAREYFQEGEDESEALLEERRRGLHRKVIKHGQANEQE
jgi:hypothetical protein